MTDEAFEARGNRNKNLLLVEGKDDEHVFLSLLAYYNVPDAFKIRNAKGISRLIDALELEVDSNELERIGVVVDADVVLEDRWNALKRVLINAGYRSIPLTPNSNGTIIQDEERPTVGIWLMPNNVLPGMIEDFIKFLVPEDDVLWPLAEEVVQKVVKTDRKFRLSYTSKAHLHTWLAWQEEPGGPMGQAITKRYLNANAPHAQELITWLRQLFEIS